jgi:Ca2+-binding EF-hand superfamily protein
LNSLFSLYDVDKSGTLEYKEFASALYGKPKTASSGGNSGPRSPDDLAEALRTKLISRGARGFIGL